VWTFRCLGKNLTDTVVTRQKHTLVTHGPYRWVRHPFGAGYLLGALAAPIAINDVRMFLIALPLVALTLAAAFREERVWLSSPRADEYRAYRKRTGMFIPFVGRD